MSLSNELHQQIFIAFQEHIEFAKPLGTSYVSSSLVSLSLKIASPFNSVNDAEVFMLRDLALKVFS